MNNAWNFFKLAIPQYLCQSADSFYHSDSQVTVARSPINNKSFNFATIDGFDPIHQEKTIVKNLKVDSFIFSHPSSKNAVGTWAEKRGLEYVGSAPLMTRLETNKHYRCPIYDSISFKLIQEEPTAISDYFKVVSEVRDIDQEELRKLFSVDIFQNNHYCLVAYYDGVPAGIFHAVTDGTQAFLVDACVLPSHQNSGLLKIMANYAKEHGAVNNILTYYAIITSPFSYNVVAQEGYRVESLCDIWHKPSK
jgi:hypothetical protein